MSFFPVHFQWIVYSLISVAKNIYVNKVSKKISFRMWIIAERKKSQCRRACVKTQLQNGNKENGLKLNNYIYCKMKREPAEKIWSIVFGMNLIIGETWKNQHTLKLSEMISLVVDEQKNKPFKKNGTDVKRPQRGVNILLQKHQHTQILSKQRREKNDSINWVKNIVFH